MLTVLDCINVIAETFLIVLGLIEFKKYAYCPRSR